MAQLFEISVLLLPGWVKEENVFTEISVIDIWLSPLLTWTHKQGSQNCGEALPVFGTSFQVPSQSWISSLIASCPVFGSLR